MKAEALRELGRFKDSLLSIAYFPLNFVLTMVSTSLVCI